MLFLLHFNTCLLLKTWHGLVFSYLGVQYFKRVKSFVVFFHCILWCGGNHYTDVIMTTMTSQITSLTVVYSTVYSDAYQRKHQPFIQTHIKENIKAPRHWPLCGEFTGTGEFPAQRASYAENVAIWWRHHDLKKSHQISDVVDPCPEARLTNMDWL